MSDRTYGILFRVYTPKEEEVPGRVERALTHVRQALEVRKEFPALRRATILIPRDYDCGKTAHTLYDRVMAEGLSDYVKVYTPPGHHSCEVLNYGLLALLGSISHALIISGKAMSYLTMPNLRTIDNAFARGAKVAGLAIDELRDIVLAGRPQNTFAAWDINALRELDVFGFDSRTDVEEIASLIRLARRYGKCIAPIDVKGGALDIHTSETARKRHEEVMTQKAAKQLKECRRLGVDLAFIKAAIME